MKAAVGSFIWADLTVPDAERIRDFYSAVVGFEHVSLDMGGYSDYCMNSPDDGQTKAGICHALKGNKDLPPVWLIYFHVADLDDSLKTLKEMGGEILSGPRAYGPGARYAIIRDPAGACCALFQEATE
ncbi:MAG TPA: VOC family protein [Saprospiraceae bacterium]|nr:VOC family protein [Saprospiraceae bacterium]